MRKSYIAPVVHAIAQMHHLRNLKKSNHCV